MKTSLLVATRSSITRSMRTSSARPARSVSRRIRSPSEGTNRRTRIERQEGTIGFQLQAVEAQLAQVEYPVTREDLVETAEDNEAPVEVINFFKALPKERYGSAEEVLRDFAEAERRFALGNAPDDRGRRDNIGKVAAEDQSKHP